MKKIITVFKGLTLFITAIWGVLFGTLSPVAMLTMPAENGIPAGLPGRYYVMWMIIALAGFVIPCFLVMLKLYKTAAVLCAGGTVALFIMHSLITSGGSVSGDVVALYFPLVFETISVTLIAVLGNIDVISDKRSEREKRKNAPAPSILGNGLYEGGQNGKRGNAGSRKGKGGK
ncbi:MAG: hypothetical protein LBI38_05045 [Oscillospiraceae bacterium]|jgi:hypothetical protein|nr:hypothetical protein [Oscillospiraceae bacterium]